MSTMDPIDLIRKGKLKRFFRATRKLNAPHLVSHITQRAAGKEPLFLENDDYLFMLGLLKDVSNQFSLEMYAFCLMPNHVHLLFSPREDNLYDAMRILFSRYAMKFNRKYERKGHLFAGPYRQSVCMDDGYLLAASLYIHLNPVKAGLAKNPQDYRWSSCRLYYNYDAQESFLAPDFVLGLLSGPIVEGKKKYRDLLTKGTKIEMERIFEHKDAIGNFQKKIIELFPTIFRHVANKKHIAETTGIDLIPMNELDNKVESVKRSKYDLRPESRNALRYLIEQLIARGYKRDEISERLGLSRKTIYNILRSSI
jgi:putative transposase